MSVLNENQLIGASAGGEYEVGQSLRFDAGRNTHLSRTPSVAGNRKTFTYSVWIKRSKLYDQQRIFGASSSSSHECSLHIYQDTVEFFNYYGSSGYPVLTTTQVFRDPSAWYHLVIVADTTNSTQGDRLRMYVNGERVTSFSQEVYPSLNYDYVINESGISHLIGLRPTNLTNNFSGYMGEINFIDGQALTPDSFGETGLVYGEWKPKKYGGSYGTNGFFLPFEQDYSVEGFSTTIYEGTAASKYVGGAGFHPDLSWMKSRSHATNHEIQDSVRGNERLFPNLSNAASELRNGFVGFAPDGINLDGRGGGGEVNSNDRTKVVWNWDMGDNNPTGFSAVKYNGTSLVNKITGVGFSPDLIWTKARNQTYSNTLYDSVRGIDKAFRTNTTDAATDYGNMLETFDEDGFTIGDYSQINYANDYHIAWCWDMGDSTVSNTSGTIASQVRANTTYGQSIVTYTGSGSDATVGTGLSQTPDLIITKRVTSTSEYWIVWHSGFCDSDGDWTALQVAQAARVNGEVMYDASGFTSSTFGIRGGATGVNVSGAPQVSYCFHDVAGYSKFGSYSGSGSSGNAVTLGFRPSFLMIKRVDAAGEWVIVDSTRNPTNPANLILCANDTSKEADFGTTNRNIDLTSTGFTIQSTAAGGTTALNNSSGTYIYIAFAGGLDSIAPVNTSGNIESRVKANPTYGQSIVSYAGASNATGDSSNNGGSYWTIGHGLSQAPELILVKKRNSTAAWYMGHQSLTSTPWQSGSHVVLNTIAANADEANILWGNAAPTSSVFSAVVGM